MNQEFVPYELAVKLKKLGFDEDCFKCKVIGQEHLDYTPSDYDDFPEQKEIEVLIPIFSQAFRWFREKRYRFNIANDSTKENSDYYYDVWYNGRMYESYYLYKTYEEAELACLDKLIELTFKSE